MIFQARAKGNEEYRLLYSETKYLLNRETSLNNQN